MNYKPWSFCEVGNHIKHKVPIDSVRVLSYHFNLSSAEKSLQDNGISYQVPTGKKFISLVLSIAHQNTSTQPLFGSSSTSNGAPSPLSFQFKLHPSNSLTVFSIHVEAVASYYIAFDPVGTKILSVQVIGYEVDA